MTTTFQSIGIQKNLIKGLTEMGITTPTLIQEKAIPYLLNPPVDLVGQAATGTGKTAAYGLPLLQQIRPGTKHIQGLILCPTRELGQQIAHQLFRFTKYSDRIYTECVYGGAKIGPQIKALKRPTHILVATPGRLIELVQQKAVDLTWVRTIILDEADEMLSLGFREDLDHILSMIARVENKWLFSATLPEAVHQIIKMHLSAGAQLIRTNEKSGLNKKVEHQFVVCDEREKFFVLQQFLQSKRKQQGVVFCKTKETAKKVHQQLQASDFSVAALHGDRLQKDREKALRQFKKGDCEILVATDIAARGIHVDNLRFVVHFELPSKDEYYVHRSGRTGRGGKEGLSLTLCTSKELRQLRFLEKKMGVSLRQIRRVK